MLIGQVSTADPEAGTVRVAFADRDDMVSGPLPVVTPGGWARGNAIPGPGESVVCMFLDSGRSAGICLGTYYGQDDPPPGTTDQRGTWFEDGSYVYYDRDTRMLNVKAAGGVHIEGDLIVTGTVSSGGGGT